MALNRHCPPHKTLILMRTMNYRQGCQSRFEDLTSGCPACTACSLLLCPSQSPTRWTSTRLHRSLAAMCRVTLAVNTFMAASLDMPLHASHASHLTLLPGIDIMPTFNAHASVNAQRQTSFIPANSHYGQRCLVLVQALPLSLNVVPTSCPVCPPVLAARA